MKKALRASERHLILQVRGGEILRRWRARATGQSELVEVWAAKRTGSSVRVQWHGLT